MGIILLIAALAVAYHFSEKFADVIHLLLSLAGLLIFTLLCVLCYAAPMIVAGAILLWWFL